MEEPKKKENSQASLIAKDIFASTVGGTFGLACTHPIDTIRIRMQLQSYPNKQYKTMFHWGYAAIRREGIRGLFKGVISNACGSAPIYTFCFTSKELWSRLIKPLNLNQQAESFISGLFAGVFTWISTVPAEMLKWRAQADKFNYIEYRNSIKKIYHQKGIRGIYQGWWVTLIRDVPWSGLYFWSYDTITTKWIKPDDSPKRKYTIKVIAGGIAGILDWIPTYPLDVVKTKIQTDTSYKTPTIYQTMKKYYKLQGPRFFFKGIIPTWFLAFPLNAIIFITYDEIIEFLG